MNVDFERLARWSALGAAAAGVVSIAASQILLGLALALLLVGRLRWRAPAHWPALALFAAWTLLSLALSDAPRAGLPQVRKLYVWLMLVVVVSTFRGLADLRLLSIAWLAGATLSAWRGLYQFAVAWMHAAAANVDFYQSYVAQRITGFSSHWMTFSGQLMFALLAGVALLCWGRPSKRLRWAVWAALPVLALALLLAFTRGIWIAAGAGLLYLLWSWKRWTVALLPLAAALAFFAGPQGLRERATSLVRPHGEMDSNTHRIYTFRTGVEMMRAHPLFGVGPERVGPHFREYIPGDLAPTPPEGYYGHLHSIYVHFAAERGVPAMAALLWFLLAYLVDFWRAATRGSPHEWAARAGVALLVGVLVSGLFEYNLGDSEVLGMTAACLGAVEVALRRASEAPAPA